ncbi:hypothetical protein ACPPVT_18895 [Angustibacter sp. McL0619]|uniref:hypothetical protein n=1 Tax=Angustibacter sp. McL0619 TaxID=3415676 RepID=UPI003CE6FFB7
MKDDETGGDGPEESQFVVGPVDPIADPQLLPAVVAVEEEGFLTDLGAGIDQPDTADPDGDPDVDPNAPTDVDGQDDNPDEDLPGDDEIDGLVDDVDVGDVDDVGFGPADEFDLDLFNDVVTPGGA